MEPGVKQQLKYQHHFPAVNIRETAENFEVEMAAPGMNKEDFRVELEGNELRISSERKTENGAKEGEAIPAASSATSLSNAALPYQKTWWTLSISMLNMKTVCCIC